MSEPTSTSPADRLPKHYQSAAVEDHWYAEWEKAGCFHAEVNPDKSPYTIVIPPPNVTGILHMGHALNNTLQDILVRCQRMRGRETLWLPGTDHAGIATQNVVERVLREEGHHRDDLGREAFVKRVWEWKETYGSTIINQLKKLGSSCDWRRTRFTMDDGLSRAVRTVFVRLYEEGLVYRGRRLINWCPRDHTALADDEVEHETKNGSLWHIRYPLKDGRRCLVVATTRPETMLGDTAVAVHPEDERYKDLIGQTLLLPVMDREIPIIADTFVDPSFGTGCVKVTPAHDPNDHECGLRHNLEQIVVIGSDGRMTEAAGKYAGLDRFRCREKLVAELEAAKLLEKVEEHEHAVGHCYRCNTVIEPYLSEQWFVRMKPLAEKAMEATRSGQVRFHPQRWERVYLSWLENVRDWCISRQIWWGHRIPVWYCEDCANEIVAEEDPAACPACGSEALRQDDDVLDTWFSSALWPFSTLGWPEKTPDLSYFYPTGTLVTDRGIIYFWVARMVMMGIHFLGKPPFSDVYIHGTILDEHGAKMSKSRGNGIDPLVMIQGGTQERMGEAQTFEGYGADAVRYTLCALTTEGQDIKLSPNRFEMGQHFINKVWNASRFVMISLSGVEPSTDEIKPEELAFEDRWILSRLTSVVGTMTDAFDKFRFADLAREIYDFTWRDYCDWYVEMVKGRIREGGRDAQVAGRVLAHVLDCILRCLHPIAPFFTEDVWHALAGFAPRRGLGANPPDASPFLMTASWPEPVASWQDPGIESVMTRVQEVVRAVRNVRAKFNIPPRKPLHAVISAVDQGYATALQGCRSLMESQAGLSHVEIGVRLAKPALSAAEVLPDAQVYVPLSDFMDVDVEKRRVGKDLAKKEKGLQALNAKLRNDQFLAKAPPEVIRQEEERKEELMRQIRELQDLAASLESQG